MKRDENLWEIICHVQEKLQTSTHSSVDERKFDICIDIPDSLAENFENCSKFS